MSLQPAIDKIINNKVYTFIGSESDGDYTEKATYRLKATQMNDAYCKVDVEVIECNYKTTMTVIEINKEIMAGDNFAFFPELGINVKNMIKRLFKFRVVDVYFNYGNILKFSTKAAWFDSVLLSFKEFKEASGYGIIYAESEENELPISLWVEDDSNDKRVHNITVYRPGVTSTEFKIDQLKTIEDVEKFVKEIIIPFCKKVNA